MNVFQRKTAAVKLCELRGLDPFEMVGHGADPDSNGMVPAIMLHSQRWELAAREINHALNIDWAISYAMIHREDD